MDGNCRRWYPLLREVVVLIVQGDGKNLWSRVSWITWSPVTESNAIIHIRMRTYFGQELTYNHSRSGGAGVVPNRHSTGMSL